MIKLKSALKFIWLKLGFTPFYVPTLSERNLWRRNRSFWKKLSSNAGDGCVLTEVSNNYFMQMGICLLAVLVARKYNSSIVFLETRKVSERIKYLVRSFHPKCLFLQFSADRDNYQKDSLKRAAEIYSTLKSPEDLLTLKYKGVLIGEFIYDSILRRCSTATVKRIDNNTWLELEYAVNHFDRVEEVFKKYKIEAVVLSHKVGTYSGIIMSLAISKNLECYLGIGGVGTIGKIYKDTSLSINQLSQLSPPTKIVEESMRLEWVLEEANSYINRRFEGKVAGNIDAKRAFNEDSFTLNSQESFCEHYNLENKPVAFVMLHAFNDYPHYCELIFNDYYHWLVETLKIVRENTEVNWVFKEHPSADFWPDDLDVGKTVESYCGDAGNILFLSKSVKLNGKSIRNAASWVITCIGTAGLEFSCFGIPAILAGENHYSLYGLTQNCGSVEEYKNTLGNITQFNRLSDEQINKAKVLFYLIEGVVRNTENFRVLPVMGHDDRLKSDISVLNYMVNNYSESSEYLEMLELFVNKNCTEIFVNDKRLQYLVAE